MSNCEMCGKSGPLYFVEIEGSELALCKDCSSFGKIIRKPKLKPRKLVKKVTIPKTEIVQIIRPDFPEIIRKKRAELGLKQEELAKKLAEKESIIHKIESGAYTPSISLARKLEKRLSVSLIEQKEISRLGVTAKKESLTIGDMINLK
ncbi:TIGR00270 family protein [Candidatus Woesearchaeota archaeon]|nr:TIGR00270 family protein [Candidatus Woesearchaeota archaeon]